MTDIFADSDQNVIEGGGSVYRSCGEELGPRTKARDGGGKVVKRSGNDIGERDRDGGVGLRLATLLLSDLRMRRMWRHIVVFKENFCR